MSFYTPHTDSATLLSQWRKLIQAELVAVGESSVSDSKSLQAATVYVLQGQGKRLRGILAMAVQSDLLGKIAERPDALKPALALEMLHAASLIHDDLPALDNDDMRRGRPACHRAFSEATAILTGDYLIGRAFSVVIEAALPIMQQVRVLGSLAKAWGDLCMGQNADIEKPTEPGEVQRTMELKTGALFGSAAACGAICADASDATVLAFYEWGARVGVLFQKLDDVADGDGQSGASFNREQEINELLLQLRALHRDPLHITEGVYGAIVGYAA